MPTGWIDGEGTVSSVDVQSGRGGNIYTLVFTFTVDTHYYGGTYHTSEEYHVGDTIYLTYDPRDPEKNSLTRSEDHARWIIGGLVVVGVIVIVLLVWM